MDILELKFDYEDTGFCRTYYIGKYKDKKYKIVINHEKNFDEICTATNDGEPIAGLKEGIKVLLNNKLYTVIKENGYSKLKEDNYVRRNERGFKKIRIRKR